MNFSVPSSSSSNSHLESLAISKEAINNRIERDSSSADSTPADSSSASRGDLKIDRAVHSGVLVQKSFSLCSEMSACDIHFDIAELTKTLPIALRSLTQLNNPSSTIADAQTKLTQASQDTQLSMNYALGIIHAATPPLDARYLALVSVKEVAYSSSCVTASASCSAVTTPAAHHPQRQEEEKSIAGQALELLSGSGALASGGLTTQLNQLAFSTGQPGTEGMAAASPSLGCLEFIASGKSLICDGLELHKLRLELKSMRSELANLDPGVGTSASLKAQIAQGELQLAKAGAGIAVSSALVGSTLAHSSLEITAVSAKEIFTTSMAIASNSLGIGMAVISLGLSCQQLAKDVSSYRSTSHALKEAKDPKEIAAMEIKLTDSKVGILRNVLNSSSAILSIASTAFTINALATGAIVGTAIAATGFGALALGALAIGIGIGYLVYKNRSAIKQFFSNIPTALNPTSGGAAQFNKMNSALGNQMRKDLKETSKRSAKHLQVPINGLILKRSMAFGGIMHADHTEDKKPADASQTSSSGAAKLDQLSDVLKGLQKIVKTID